jgi:hypothetical protein
MTIVTKLSGGLGNQLFQYAAGRLLSVQLAQPLEADLSWFRDVPPGSTVRTPMLHQLRLSLPEADPATLAARLSQRPSGLWRAVRRPVRQLREKKTFVHDSRLHRIPKWCELVHLDGYWQSYKYCEPVRGGLLADTRAARPLNPHYRLIADAIEASEAVMLHVRRGDYVHSTSAASTHGTLPLRYYERALRVVAERVPQPALFVFSDDIAWVREHLPTMLPVTYVDSAPGEDAVVDELMLMRACKHHVIANSSLSWWGAWLGEHPDKTVVAPNWWLAARRFDLSDLLPPSWLIVDAT